MYRNLLNMFLWQHPYVNLPRASERTPGKKKQKKEKKEKKSKKDKRKREDDSEDGGSKRSSLPLVISPIAQPLAGEKLTKKLLKLVKKVAKADSKKLRRGVKECVKYIRKGETGLCLIAGDISPMSPNITNITINTINTAYDRTSTHGDSGWLVVMLGICESLFQQQGYGSWRSN